MPVESANPPRLPLSRGHPQTQIFLHSRTITQPSIWPEVALQVAQPFLAVLLRPRSLSHENRVTGQSRSGKHAQTSLGGGSSRPMDPFRRLPLSFPEA
jgi:hypothetical protein